MKNLRKAIPPTENYSTIRVQEIDRPQRQRGKNRGAAREDISSPHPRSSVNIKIVGALRSPPPSTPRSYPHASSTNEKNNFLFPGFCPCVFTRISTVMKQKKLIREWWTMETDLSCYFSIFCIFSIEAVSGIRHLYYYRGSDFGQDFLIELKSTRNSRNCVDSIELRCFLLRAVWRKCW